MLQVLTNGERRRGVRERRRNHQHESRGKTTGDGLPRRRRSFTKGTAEVVTCDKRSLMSCVRAKGLQIYSIFEACVRV